MKPNIGTVDRALRIILGLGIIAYAMPPEGGFRNLALAEGGEVAYLSPWEVPPRR